MSKQESLFVDITNAAAARKREMRERANAKYRRKNLETVRLKNKERAAAQRREDPERVRAIQRKWHRKHGYGLARKYVFKRFGLAVEDYARIVSAQGGGCAICGRTQSGKRKVLCLDHDHKANKFRAFLCHYCNGLIGLANENPETLRRAAEYLERHGATRCAETEITPFGWEAA